jgi:tRNA(Arg) A34 adenosine deaminase TadA
MAHSLPPLSNEDAGFLAQAIGAAEAAVRRGDHPFGSVIVARDTRSGVGKVVVETLNSVVTDHDPTGHAETNALRVLGKYRAANPDLLPYTSFEMFTSTEPCTMCCGGIYWSFWIDRVVYACSETELSKFTGTDFLTPCRDNFARGTRKIRIEGPYLSDSAIGIHAAFWPTVLATAPSSE